MISDGLRWSQWVWDGLAWCAWSQMDSSRGRVFLQHQFCHQVEFIQELATKASNIYRTGRNSSTKSRLKIVDTHVETLTNFWSRALCGELLSSWSSWVWTWWLDTTLAGPKGASRPGWTRAESLKETDILNMFPSLELKVKICCTFKNFVETISNIFEAK